MLKLHDNRDTRYTKNPNRALRWVSFVSLLVVLFTILTIGNYRFSVQNPGGNDFYARWNGARFWVVDGIDPYDKRVGESAQRVIFGHLADVANGEDEHLFVYPLYSMIFFAPFGLLDYNLARALWMTLIEICTVLGALLSVRIAGWKISVSGIGGIILFSLIWYSGARGIILGQFAPVNALFMLGAIYLIQKKRDLGAGLLLALSTIKPQMSFLLIIFTFIWSISVRRMRVAVGIVAGSLLLFIISIPFLPAWPIEWLGQVLEYPEYTSRIGSVVSIIAGAFPNIYQPLSIMLNMIFVVYLGFIWIKSWARDNDNWYTWTALMTLVITNIVVIRTATTHYIVLLPALFLLFQYWQERWGKRGRILSWAVIFITFVSLWVQFLVTVTDTFEQASLYLPIPFLALVALWWISNRSLRRYALDIENPSLNAVKE